MIIPYIALGLLVLLALGSFFIVEEKTAVILQRLGRFQRIARSGLNFKIPIIDTKVGMVNLRVQQLDVNVETKTKDNVFVVLQVSVQFQVLGAKIDSAFYSLENPHQQISSYIFDEVRAEVPKLELDDVFAKKDDIAHAVKIGVSSSMEEYGFIIIKTLITDINPDNKVKEAMNRINAALRDKIAATEEAEAQKIRVVKAAEADAESKRLSGEGIARQRLEIIKGFKESIEDFQKNLNNISHAEVMQFVLMTQYFDTLNNIGANGKNSSILIPHSPSAMKDFQQQILEGTLTSDLLGKGVK
jgi:regulator of protease activity HflC (stomatin/prohibitin superfamily)